jgi:nitrite reductase/ring-hydroxylating ferredoxin subunit
MPPDSDWTRRRFCVVAGAALAGSACGGGSAQPPQADLAMPEDLGPELDLSQPLCAGTVDAGPASALQVGHAKFFSCARLFVLRDNSGIYAMTAICTHMHCVITFAGQSFACPCHNSTYDFNGNVTNPPAPLPLQHFACALDGNDHVIVDPSMPVPAATRLLLHD